MDILSNWLSSYRTLHHANLVIGEKESVVPELETFLEKSFNFNTRGNPDYWKEEFDLFGIDESRRIIESHSRKGFDSGKKIFVLSLNSISLEAQNALLKMFEEPVPATHFFVIVPTVEMIIPTLRSRFLIINTIKENNESNKELATLFVKSSMAKRMNIVADLVEAKDKRKVEQLFQGLEMIYDPNKGIALETTQFFFDEIFLCEKYVGDRASSVKLLLEHLALTLPRVL